MTILTRSSPDCNIWLPVSVLFKKGSILADGIKGLFPLRVLGCEYEKYWVFVSSQVCLCRCSHYSRIVFFETYFLKIILQKYLLNLEIRAGNTSECNLEKWKLINLSYTLTSLKRSLFFFFFHLIPSFLAVFWYLMLFREFGPFVRVEPFRVLVCGTVIKFDILTYHGKLEICLETPTLQVKWAAIWKMSFPWCSVDLRTNHYSRTS